MSYNVIQAPLTAKLREMPKPALRHYFRWFIDVIPDRIRELARAVTETAGFETWRPDKTPSSLDELGRWFATIVETRPKTEEELRETRRLMEGMVPRSAVPSHVPIEIGMDELTTKTLSFAMDVGMHFSQVLMTRYPPLQWEQRLRSKNYVDYGQPVLVEFKSGPLNPVRVAINLAYGFADKTYETYDTWAGMIK